MTPAGVCMSRDTGTDNDRTALTHRESCSALYEPRYPRVARIARVARHSTSRDMLGLRFEVDLVQYQTLRELLGAL